MPSRSASRTGSQYTFIIWPVRRIGEPAPDQNWQGRRNSTVQQLGPPVLRTPYSVGPINRSLGKVRSELGPIQDVLRTGIRRKRLKSQIEKMSRWKSVEKMTFFKNLMPKLMTGFGVGREGETERQLRYYHRYTWVIPDDARWSDPVYRCNGWPTELAQHTHLLIFHWVTHTLAHIHTNRCSYAHTHTHTQTYLVGWPFAERFVMAI